MAKLAYFLLVALMMYPAASLPAQQRSLTLRFGPGYNSRQDLIFSPFVHTDWSLVNGGLRYETQNRLHRWVDLGFGSYSPILTPSYTYGDGDQTNAHSFLLANLTYALGKPISSRISARTWVLGGFLENDIHATTYNYARVGNSGYFASIGLGMWARFSREIGQRNSIGATVQVPLLAWVARSPYLVNDDEYIENIYSHKGLNTFFAYLGDGELETLNAVRQLELHLNLSHSLSERWKIGAWYEFHLLHASKPLPLLQLRNVLNFSTTLTF